MSYFAQEWPFAYFGFFVFLFGAFALWYGLETKFTGKTAIAFAPVILFVPLLAAELLGKHEGLAVFGGLLSGYVVAGVALLVYYMRTDPARDIQPDCASDPVPLEPGVRVEARPMHGLPPKRRSLWRKRLARMLAHP
ncbi:MAG TPA: hypothetical protein VEA36_01650 [Candidatus Paceibacterota bacterium]|nr:hypothetical protein [Candidatus Paceibacterota bacterium]